ncbi:uncharacterized protein LOC134711219 [Mytilus trossulus]|uniref:uncharacterized protein LOC134711219 n=1 Tax=Mytilus trossulus TaxID=6551 RepID=UPI00300747AB
MVKALVHEGADLSTMNSKGDSPLHEAASNGKLAMAELLVSLGADLSARNNEKNSPLHEAAKNGKVGMVRRLNSLGADLSARNYKGMTPYDIAEEKYRKFQHSQFSNEFKDTLDYLKEKRDSFRGTIEQLSNIRKSETAGIDVSSLPKEEETIDKKDKDIHLPWLVDADEFQCMLSQGEFLSYENRLSLGGPCKAGKSTLASVLIGEDIPLQWNSTDGLVIFFGRNGIDIKKKKMIPLKEGERGHEILAKILRGKPNVQVQPDENTKQQLIPTYSQNSQADIRYMSSKASATQAQSVNKDKDNPAYQVATITSESITEHVETKISNRGMLPVPSEIQSIDCQTLQLQTSILDEVRDREYRIEIAPSDLVDFGGQKSYDMTHQLFIQHRGSFLLMFDGRFGLHKQLREYPEGVTSASILKHWVDSVLTYTDDTEDIMPMIMFAATHRDQCMETVKLKENFIKDLKHMFSQHEKSIHIHLETVYFINGIDKNDAEIQRLTDQVVMFAMMQSSWGQRRPMQWVPLELQISNMRMKNINIITKEDLRNVNKMNDDLALNEHQMDDFLIIQHSLGKLMYYSLPGLNNFIIIHPPALVNILRSFVTDEKFFPADKSLRYILEILTETGKIFKTDLLKLWQQDNVHQYMPSDSIKEFVVQLLVHLDILIIPKAFKQTPSVADVYLVPCMIKTIRPSDFNLGQTERTICLRYSLERHSLPTALAYKLIGGSVNAWPLKYESNKPCLYHKAAVLNVNEDTELRIWLEDNRLMVYMTNQESLLHISPDVAASVQECLTKNLEVSLSFHYKSFGRKMALTKLSELYSIEVGIPCGRNVCFKTLQDVMKDDQWTCEKGEEHKTKYLRYWIFNKAQKTCGHECKGLTDDELRAEPSDKHLVRLGCHIGINLFREYFIYLGMEVEEWEDINFQYVGHSPKGIKSVALMQWKNSMLLKSKDPTLKDLRDALKNVELDSHLICQIFRERSALLAMADFNLQTIPSDQHLKELSNQVGNCPLQLGVELGLSFTEIEQSLFSFPKDLPGLVEDVLTKWRRKSKVKTIYSLMLALERVNTGGLQYLREISKRPHAK